eukprot:1392473-Alexandrium_andersonii.AAC.1
MPWSEAGHPLQRPFSEPCRGQTQTGARTRAIAGGHQRGRGLSLVSSAWKHVVEMGTPLYCRFVS